MKRWLAVVVLTLAGVLLHDVWAAYLVDERLAGVLLSAGAGARPVEALVVLLFVALRLVGFPLAMAIFATAAVRALWAAWKRGRVWCAIHHGSDRSRGAPVVEVEDGRTRELEGLEALDPPPASMSDGVSRSR